MRLKEKIAIVTGAAAGIGAATASLFAREGAVVVAVDRNSSALEKVVGSIVREGNQAHGQVADLAREEECARVARWTLDQFRHLDVLFNNAGIVHSGTLLEARDEEWDEALTVNAKSMFWMCRHSVPAMIRQGSGSVVNMSSVASTWGVKNRGVYSVSKAAVLGLTKSLAIDLVQHGIRVNAICPATVDTPSLRERIAASPDPEKARSDFLARQPMGRLGTPEEIAALALYLASDESAYMTGQALLIDGGMKL